MVRFFSDNLTNKNFNLLLKSYFWIWVSYFAFFALLGLLKYLFPEVAIEKYEQTQLRDLIENNPIQLLVLGVIIAPILEELLFRTLLKPTHPEFLLFLSGLTAFIFNIVAAPYGNWILRSILLFIILIVTYYILQEIISERKTQRIRAFLAKYVWTVLIITSIVFGLAHVNNYVDSFFLNLALFLLIVPRIIIGFIAGRLKLQSGAMLWPILLHFMNNAFLITLVLFGKSIS